MTASRRTLRCFYTTTTFVLYGTALRLNRLVFALGDLLLGLMNPAHSYTVFLVFFLTSQESSVLATYLFCSLDIHAPRDGRWRRERLSSYAMPLHQVSSKYSVGRRPSGVSGPTREGLVEKLNDARCKWMVTLHRYSSKTHRGNVQQDAVRKTSVCRSSIPGRGYVPAADFCPECGSMVPAELECSNDGEFVAEHRWGCSVCESGQRTCFASANKTGTPGSHRITGNNSRRRFLDQDWRLWKVGWMFKLAYQKRSPCPVVYGNTVTHSRMERRGGCKNPVCGEKEASGVLYGLSKKGWLQYCREFVNPNRVTHPTPALTVQDQISTRQLERSGFNTPRRSGYIPNASFVAGEDPDTKPTNQHVADSFEAVSESRTHRSAEGQANRWPGREDPGTARREVLVLGLTPSASRANRNSESRNRTPTEKQRACGSSDQQASSNPVRGEQVGDDHASGSQAGASGGASRNEGTLPVDGEWAEQIREKDELISTLKRQLTALGEKPMEEVVSLEVPVISRCSAKEG